MQSPKNIFSCGGQGWRKGKTCQNFEMLEDSLKNQKGKERKKVKY